MPPTEFNACASVSRTGALCSGPRIATYGFAAVCSAVTPAPTMNTAVRNSGKLTIFAAGTNSRHPNTWMNSETTIVRLYPIVSISFEVGDEKTK